MASEEVQSKKLELLYVPTGRILMYADGTEGSKSIRWIKPSSELFPTRAALEKEISDIINMSIDENYHDKEGIFWCDCFEWVEANDIVRPIVEADFEIIEISSDDADNQKN